MDAIQTIFLACLVSFFCAVCGQPRRGILNCNGNEFDFRMLDAHIQEISSSNDFVVESLRVGPEGSGPECAGYRFPQNRPADSFSIGVPYSQCNVTVDEDLTREVVTYSADAHITVLDRAAAIRRKYKMKLNCEGSLKAQTVINTTSYGHTTVLPGITVPFDITFSMTPTQEVRDSFGNDRNVNIHILTLELDPEFQSTYTILGNRCWATPIRNQSSEVFYEVISTQGCNNRGPNFVAASQPTPYRQVVEINAFQFKQETTVIYFHCDVNVCPKDGPQTRCTTACASARAAATGADFRLSSGRTVPNPDVPPNVIVDETGQPSLIKSGGARVFVSFAVVLPALFLLLGRTF